MTIDWTINLTSIFTIAGFLLTIVGIYFDNKHRWKESDKRWEMSDRRWEKDIGDIKFDIKTLNQTVTDVALQKQRLDSADARFNEQARRINTVEEKFDKRYDELRRSEGLIVHSAERGR
jgi:hypothetical protein